MMTKGADPNIFINEDTMKTITTYGLAAILLVGLTASAVGQIQDRQDAQAARAAAMEAQQRQMAAMREMQRSPAMQQMQRNSMRQMMNSFWEGDGSSMMANAFLHQRDFRQGIGVSDEQWQRIMRAPSEVMENNPRFQEIQTEMMEFMTQDGGPFGPNGTEEMQNRYIELQMQMQTELQGDMMERMQNAVNENLTPDQIQKIQEAQISAMSTFPIVSPNMFEALGLSDAQKQQLDGIKREMAPEFERHVDKLVDMSMKMSEAMQDEMERINDIMRDTTDHEERMRLMENLHENIRRDNPDLQQAINEMMESGREFSDSLKFRMFDVLTDEQWERMIDLVDNPPDYVRAVIAEMRRSMGADDSGSDGQWRPGPNSWQPGEGVPEEYRRQRNTPGGFPSGVVP